MRAFAVSTMAAILIAAAATTAAQAAKSNNSNASQDICKERYGQCIQGCGGDQGCKVWCLEEDYPRCVGGAGAKRSPTAVVPGGAGRPKGGGVRAPIAPAQQ